MVYRIYVEKRPEYAVEARGILSEIRHLLRIKSVTGLRLLNRYDVEGISEELFSQCCGTVFSEPQLDFTYTAVPEGADAVFATEFLPGQFDQRAASAAECIQLISQGERPHPPPPKGQGNAGHAPLRPPQPLLLQHHDGRNPRRPRRRQFRRL